MANFHKLLDSDSERAVEEGPRSPIAASGAAEPPTTDDSAGDSMFDVGDVPHHDVPETVPDDSPRQQTHRNGR